MLLHVRDVLTPAEVSGARGILATAPWGDGRMTAGSQSAQAKNNQQLPEDCDATRAVQQLLLRGLERSAMFFSAALPKQISPPLFNRYAGRLTALARLRLSHAVAARVDAEDVVQSAYRSFFVLARNGKIVVVEH